AHFRDFLTMHHLGGTTHLAHATGPLLCLCDPRPHTALPPGAECLALTHPLMQWLRHCAAEDRTLLCRVAAIRVPGDRVGCLPGLYVFVGQRWACEGLLKEQQLAFQVLRVSDQAALDSLASEQLVEAVARHGEAIPEAASLLQDRTLWAAVAQCEQRL